MDIDVYTYIYNICACDDMKADQVHEMLLTSLGVIIASPLQLPPLPCCCCCCLTFVPADTSAAAARADRWAADRFAFCNACAAAAEEVRCCVCSPTTAAFNLFAWCNCDEKQIRLYRSDVRKVKIHECQNWTCVGYIHDMFECVSTFTCVMGRSDLKDVWTVIRAWLNRRRLSACKHDTVNTLVYLCI
jgi:hypothetical protein